MVTTAIAVGLRGGSCLVHDPFMPARYNYMNKPGLAGSETRNCNASLSPGLPGLINAPKTKNRRWLVVYVPGLDCVDVEPVSLYRFQDDRGVDTVDARQLGQDGYDHVGTINFEEPSQGFSSV